jgi:hypothetical protein
MNFLKKHLSVIILTAAGAAGGFLYWRFVGCQTGSCPIKSRWYLMILYGSLIGYLVGSLSLDVKAWIKRRRELNNRIEQNKDSE